eukprot:gnl/TRDRNA2_/TRDRNA2_87743_c0_seq1.p1 gnl/TRDRNA2_/TRDRNA2_87743_c0~~gnl/TRDRNA2_/TRDRNA2_87743_c0_seq1.p1  ORF type:complete len:272 (-),score=30.64 gnl/TRDRNA2_/TRDRNA2_87743_c0_seq1:23-796(-)
MDGDPDRCSQYYQRWEGREHMVLCKALLLRSWEELSETARAVADGLGDLMVGAGTGLRPPPLALDVMKIDIDSADCGVVGHWLRVEPALRPKVLLVEAHPLPPPLKFMMFDVEDEEVLNQPGGGDDGRDRRYSRRVKMGLYGCSLSAWTAMLEPYGYRLLSFLHKDASFVHFSFLQRAFPEAVPRDSRRAWGSNEFVCYNNAVLDSGTFAPQKLRSWFYAHDPYEALRAARTELMRRAELLAAEFTGSRPPTFALTI